MIYMEGLINNNLRNDFCCRTFRGSINEKRIVANIKGDNIPAIKVGDVILQIDQRYFRPAEVETLLGDPTKAKQILGWVPEITAQEICTEMVAEDLKSAQRHGILKQHSHDISASVEG